MTAVRNGLMALVLIGGLVGPGPAALAAEEPNERERAEELARQAMEQLMQAIEMFLQSIPQYEMPEVNEHGDIIIRRKRPSERRPAEPEEPELDSTRT